MDKVEIIDRIADNDKEVVKDVVLELLIHAYNNKRLSSSNNEQKKLEEN